MNTNDLVHGYQRFALNLGQTIVKSRKPQKTFMYSPASVLFALLLCGAGAEGETKEEIRALFGTPFDDLEAFAKAWMEDMHKDEDVTIHTADALMVNTDMISSGLKEDYVTRMQDMYNALVKAMPFDQDTAGVINDWVKDNTNGMIGQLVDESVVMTACLLLNAIAFEGAWNDAFDVLDERDFHNNDGTKTKTKFIGGEADLYVSSGRATGFLKTYRGRRYAFMGLRPTCDVSAETFLKGLDLTDWAELFSGASREYDVDVRMPAFAYDDDMSLKDVLKAMGMVKAFEPEADFSVMCDKGLTVSDVLHKTHIELDENGTKAAAVTAVLMMRGMPPGAREHKSVTLDKPFAWAIIDTMSGLPLFMGGVSQL